MRSAKKSMQTLVGAALVLALLLALCLFLMPFSAAAENDCHCPSGYENGYCMECGYQEAKLNAGENAEDASDDFYEIGNMGQLYWFAGYLKAKAPETPVRAKLTANILLTENLDENGALVTEPSRIWVPFGVRMEEALDENEEVILAVTEVKTVKNVTFDGQGHYISGLYAKYTNDAPAGLFGVVEDVVICNLGIVNSYFESEVAVGGIAARTANSCYVVNCYAYTTQVGTLCGGIVGEDLSLEGAGSTVKGCVTDAACVVVTPSQYLSVTECYYKADAETDTLEGTTAQSATAFSTGAVKTVLDSEACAWYQSCARALPMLLPEHTAPHICDVSCSVCNGERTDRAPHAFVGDCDSSCSTCGGVRLREDTAPHTRYNKCSDDTCNVCGEKLELTEPHKFESVCDATCNNPACTYTREAAEHAFLGVCDNDCENAGCTYARKAEAHTYDDGCDKFCNVCKALRVQGYEHVYDNVCDVDCNKCADKREVTHAFGDAVILKQATKLKAGLLEKTCTLCGHKETEEIPALGGWPVWLILLVVTGGLVLLAAILFVIYWCMIRKRSLGDIPRVIEKRKADKAERARKQRRQAEKEEKKQKKQAQANLPKDEE